MTRSSSRKKYLRKPDLMCIQKSQLSAPPHSSFPIGVLGWNVWFTYISHINSSNHFTHISQLIKHLKYHMHVLYINLLTGFLTKLRSCFIVLIPFQVITCIQHILDVLFCFCIPENLNKILKQKKKRTEKDKGRWKSRRIRVDEEGAVYPVWFLCSGKLSDYWWWLQGEEGAVNIQVIDMV